MRLLIALIVASIAISFTDWLFFGVLYHDRYMQTPNVWREGSERNKIVWSMALAALGVAGFLFLAQVLNVHGSGPAFVLALLVWVAASLPQTATTTLYVKYSPVLGVSHALGWLARLVITAAAYAIIVR